MFKQLKLEYIWAGAPVSVPVGVSEHPVFFAAVRVRCLLEPSEKQQLDGQLAYFSVLEAEAMHSALWASTAKQCWE